QPPGLIRDRQADQDCQHPRGAVTDQSRECVNGSVERARPDADEQFVMNPRPAREQVMLPAVLLAAVVEQKQHRHACGGANGQPEKYLTGMRPETRGENLHQVPNGNIIGSRVEDLLIADCGLRTADCGLRIDSYEMSQARGDTIKAGFSESTNPQSAIRNPQSASWRFTYRRA